MVIVTDQMKQAMDDDPVEFGFEGCAVKGGIVADGVDADEQIARQGIPFAIIKGNDVGIVLVPEITDVHVKDVRVGTKDHGQVADLPALYFRHLFQPAVGEPFLTEGKNDIFAKVLDHVPIFSQIYNY